MHYDALALAAVFLLVLGFMYRRNRIRTRLERAALHDDCLDLYETHELAQDAVNYPVLTGRYRGYAVEVEPLVDHVVFRKIPSLWILVTVFGEIPYGGVFDLLVRPQNVEFYSPSSTLGTIIPNPPGWPREATLRTDDRATMPPLDDMARHLVLFDDVKAKELLVTRRGVRIVYQADQASRGHYMVFRQMNFEDVRLQPGIIAMLLDWAIAVHQDLTRERHRSGAGSP